MSKRAAASTIRLLWMVKKLNSRHSRTPMEPSTSPEFASAPLLKTFARAYRRTGSSRGSQFGVRVAGVVWKARRAVLPVLQYAGARTAVRRCPDGTISRASASLSKAVRPGCEAWLSEGGARTMQG